MKKFLLSLIAITTICTNVWGDGEYSWNSSTKTLTINKAGDYSDGVIDDISDITKTGWYSIIKNGSPSGTKPEHLVIEDGITHLGAYTFYNCSTAVDITLPKTLETIGCNAFYGCSNLSKVYFIGSPNQWAHIDFQEGGGASIEKAHPFGTSTATKRNFYFYGKTGADSTKILTFKAGLTEIKKYAFYKVTGIEEVNIPGTVESIGQKALYCNIKKNLAINRQTPPDTGEDAISFKNNNYANQKTRLYVPKGAKNGYANSPWYYNGDVIGNRIADAPGAHYIGYSGDNSSIIDGNVNGVGKTYITQGDIDDISWVLEENGTLTLTGSGSISSSFAGSPYTSASILPWGPFRRLVNKAVIRANGEDITALNNVLQYCYAIDSIIIEQNTIPTGTYSVTDDFRKTTDKVKLLVKANAASINAANESDTWNIDRIQIGLNEAAVYAENQNNSALVTALGVLDLPFNLQLNRSMGKTTEYFSFCSPIDMDAAQIEEIFGADAQLHTMTGSSYNEETEELALDFEDRTTIDAGVPYLIKPSKVVSNPVIEGVTADDLATTADEIDGDHVTFYGTLAPRTVDPSEADGKMIILLGGNELTWANGGTIGGMRAFWLLDKSAPAGMPKARIVMRIGKVATGVESIQTSDIRSQKILRDGQLYLLYEGKMYDVRGQLIK